MAAAGDTSEDVRLLYVTCRDADEARELSHALIDSQLAACTNTIGGMTSTYRWKDAIETSVETILIVKTTAALAPRASAFIVSRHSYETPCVLEIPIASGSAPFISYIVKNCLSTTTDEPREKV